MSKVTTGKPPPDVSMRRLRCALAASASLASIAWAGLAGAQIAPAPQPPGKALAASGPDHASGQDDTNPGLMLSEVVVTGSRDAVTKLKAPYAISTINGEAIAEHAPRSVADLLKSTPGINVEASGGEAGGENVVIRGLPFAGWRLIDLTQDGVPLYESNFERFFNIDELYIVDFGTERAEVVRGGTASIYSNNASGGVVNFITRHGTATPQGAIQVETGSASRARVNAYWSGPLLENLTASVSGSYRRSDGLRDPGFSPANDGGQIRAGLQYTLPHGHIFADVTHIDDKGIFYTDFPLTDPRPGPSQGASLNGLINRNSGTLDSASDRFVILRTLNGAPGGAIVARDLADGIDTDVTYATLGGDYDLGHGFTVSDKLRHTEGQVRFNGIFNGSPSDAQAFLSSQLARAKAAFPLATSVRYVLAGTNTPFDPASTAGLVIANNWNSITSNVRDTINDLRLGKTLKTGLGVHDITLGAYYSSFAFRQQQLNNAILNDVKNRPDTLDIQAVDAAGSVQGLVTENGFVSYGSGSLNGSLTGHAFSYYAADRWAVTPRLTLDAGVRVERRTESGSQGVLGTQNVAPAGPLAARNVQGVVSYRPRRESLVGTAYTFGAAYDVTPEINAFVRYGKSYSYPRFDDIYGGATLNGGQVPLTDVTQAEGGVKYSRPYLQLFLVGFWDKYTNLSSSTQVVDSLGNIQTPSLLLGTTTYGAELEASWTPVSFIQINASGSLQDPTYDSVVTLTNPGGVTGASAVGNTLARIPKFNLTLEPAYLFKAFGAEGRLFASVNYISRRYQDVSNLSVLPAYATLDFGVSLRLPHQLDVRGLINNVTDSDGLTEGNARAAVLGSGGSGLATVGRPIFGRNLVVSLTKRW